MVFTTPGCCSTKPGDNMSGHDRSWSLQALPWATYVRDWIIALWKMWLKNHPKPLSLGTRRTSLCCRSHESPPPARPPKANHCTWCVDGCKSLDASLDPCRFLSNSVRWHQGPSSTRRIPRVVILEGRPAAALATAFVAQRSQCFPLCTDLPSLYWWLGAGDLLMCTRRLV